MCCCETSLCNHVDKINLDPCLEDRCDENESDTCFCPPKPVGPTQGPNPSDRLFVTLLCAVVVIIIVAIIGAITYWILRNRFRHSSSHVTEGQNGATRSSEIPIVEVPLLAESQA